jgi:hypothetical protein
METPTEFRRLAQHFHQDIDITLGPTTPEGLVAHLLRTLRRHQQLVVGQFLSELLKSNPSGDHLQAIWNSAGSDWGFEDSEELRAFLALIRDMIDMQPESEPEGVG